MTTIPTILVTPSGAANAYNRVTGAPGTPSQGAADPAASFGQTVSDALNGAIATGKTADAQAVSAINGDGNLTNVVTALSHAEMTLQTATTIRDRVLQAYQDIIRMPI